MSESQPAETTAGQAADFELSNILLVRLSSIGDVVHTLPALSAIRSRFPAARIDWLVESGCRQVLESNPDLDSIIEVDTLRWRRRLLSPRTLGELHQSVRAIRRRRYDVVLDLQGTLKSAVASFLARTPKRIGFTASHLRERLATLFYNERFRPFDSGHVIDRHLELLKAIGIETKARRFPIAIPPEAEVFARKSLESLSLSELDYVLLNPGASWRTKRWDPARFGELAHELWRQWGLKSLVLWGPQEKRIAETIVQVAKGSAQLAPPTSLSEMLPFVRGARLFVSGDTGPMHLASALEVPVVGIFGPTDPKRNGPFGDNDRVVFHAVDCGPCYKKRCPGFGNICLTSIEVQDVVRAAGEILQLNRDVAQAHPADARSR